MRTTWTRPLTALCAALVAAGCGTAGTTGVAGTGHARAGALYASAADTPRSVARLHFTSVDQLEAIARAGVDLFENVDRDHGTVSASLTARTEAALKKLGVSYTPVQGSERMHVQGFPSGYQTVDQVMSDMKAVADAHPAFVKLVKFGDSLEGRPLVALRFTSKPDTGLPAIRINSGQHARELPPVELTSRLIHLLADGYGKDARITGLIDTRDIWIVPLVNPDGRVKVQEGNSMWRKNARPLGMGANGVDTNRNADDHWSGGNGMKWADDYHGDKPFSEPETQGVRDLCTKMKFKASLDIHNFAGMILWPPGFSNGFSKDEAAFKAIGSKLGGPIGYKYGTIANTIYKTFGDVSTWEYETFGTLAFAAELADSGFSANYSEVEKDWKAWQPNFLYLIDAAGNPNAERNPAPGFASAFHF